MFKNAHRSGGEWCRVNGSLASREWYMTAWRLDGGRRGEESSLDYAWVRCLVASRRLSVKGAKKRIHVRRRQKGRERAWPKYLQRYLCLNLFVCPVSCVVVRARRQRSQIVDRRRWRGMKRTVATGKWKTRRRGQNVSTGLGKQTRKPGSITSLLPWLRWWDLIMVKMKKEKRRGVRSRW